MITAFDMSGKVALVTGAAGGLGKATAARLARAGANLCIVDIDAEGLDQAATELRASGVEVASLALDLADPESAGKAVALALANFQRLDALCNVAAVFIARHTAEMTLEELDQTLAVNLRAPFLLFQAAIPHLIAAEGAVVNVTSCAAFVGQAYTTAYCATKAGLTHLTKSLAMEYMHQPVRINAVAPGGMMTRLAAGLFELQDADPTLLQRYSPLRGVVEIEQVAEMVAFLVSDAASGYHGASFSIDNGITAG